MANNMQEHQSKFQKAKLCSSNGAHEARQTAEGWVCRIYGKVCPYQTQMSKSFTNYYVRNNFISEHPKNAAHFFGFCGKISTAKKYEQKYNQGIASKVIPVQSPQTRADEGQGPI
jgi:hypothetical protein